MALGGVELAEIPLEGDEEVAAQLVVHRILDIVVGRDMPRGTRAVENIVHVEADGELFDAAVHTEIPQQVRFVVTGGETLEEVVLDFRTQFPAVLRRPIAIEINAAAPGFRVRRTVEGIMGRTIIGTSVQACRNRFSPITQTDVRSERQAVGDAFAEPALPRKETAAAAISPEVLHEPVVVEGFHVEAVQPPCVLVADGPAVRC